MTLGACLRERRPSAVDPRWHMPRVPRTGREAWAAVSTLQMAMHRV